MHLAKVTLFDDFPPSAGTQMAQLATHGEIRTGYLNVPPLLGFQPCGTEPEALMFGWILSGMHIPARNRRRYDSR